MWPFSRPTLPIPPSVTPLSPPAYYRILSCLEGAKLPRFIGVAVDPGGAVTLYTGFSSGPCPGNVTPLFEFLSQTLQLDGRQVVILDRAIEQGSIHSSTTSIASLRTWNTLDAD